MCCLCSWSNLGISFDIYLLLSLDNSVPAHAVLKGRSQPECRSGCSSTDTTVLLELVLLPLHLDDDHLFALVEASFNSFDSV